MTAQTEFDTFSDKLEMALKLTIDGAVFSIPGANIKFLEVRLHPYGFEGRLRFWVSSETKPDKLFPEFVTDKLIGVNLKVSSYFKPEEIEIDPLVFQGYVSRKAILEELTIDNVHLRGDPVLYRQYEIDFADPARVLWGQHFPCDLKVDASVKELIDANKASEVNLKYDWDKVEEKFAINTLSLGGPDNEASFLDFILWYSYTLNGVFVYDTLKNEYTLAEKKPSSGEVFTMSELEVASQQIIFPPTIRYNDRLRNALSENPQENETDRDQAQTDYWRDHLKRMPVAADFENAFQLASSRQIIRSHEVHLTHRRLPQLTYRPGIFVKLEKGLWTDEAFFVGKEYRVRDISMTAQALKDPPDIDHNMDYASYQIEMDSQLELRSEAALNLPDFKTPAYPILVEGKVVSEQGTDEQLTYQIYEHPQSGLDQYRIKIPLFDNQQVVAPYEPIYFPGHFYFPAYKDERVLVALGFHAARIERFLDWRTDGRLPMDSQGNHLLLGKSQNSNTSISHVYTENKPQLNMLRTSDKDTESIQLHEGTIILQTKEEDS